jgi:hypothetical protein
MRIQVFALLFIASAMLGFQSVLATSEKGVIAKYEFDEGAGQPVADSSGNNHDGVIVGDVKWVDGLYGKALLFDGLNRVTIPSSPQLSLSGPTSITLWMRGHSGKFRLMRMPTAYSSMRGPFFQVCGDTIYFATNSDHASTENPSLSQDKTLKKHPAFPWNDWHMWTGTVDINLTNWHDTQRTKWPNTGLEPKLQVVGDTIYYEDFGQDSDRAWQIWTAESKVDGSGWKTVQRTFEKEGYRTEQEGNHQVVGDKIYYGWPEKDEHDDWQLWTAISKTDGSDFHAVKRTNDSGWIPNIQVAGDKVYYIYPTIRFPIKDPARQSTRDSLFFAESNREGGNWRVIREIKNMTLLGWYAFQVDKGTIYFAHGGMDEENKPHLYTGSMRTDGSDFQETARTSGETIGGVSHSGVQIIGSRVYYAVIQQANFTNPDEVFKWKDEDFKQHSGRMGITAWTASANLDGSDWKIEQQTKAPPDIYFGYRGISIVGGKSYFGAAEDLTYPDATHTDRMHAMLATAGSNLVHKGDAYGIGLTDLNQLRGFINAGRDYLFRAEAPEDTAGVVADFIDSTVDDNTWHQVAMTYDRNYLKLYVNGELKTTAPYRASAGRNPFPLIIGDGFEGVLDDITIYDRVLDPGEILDKYRAVRSSLRGR